MKILVVLSILVCAPALAAAQDVPANPSTRVDVPLLDLPYNTAHGYRAPSMAQSLALGETFYESMHRVIQRAWRSHTLYARFSIAAADVFDTLLLPLPGSDGWLHEEYHRAVLGRRGFHSFNDVYRFQFAADAISVSHVADADLVLLKTAHPAEQVRLSAAGIEGEYLLVKGLEQREFFDRARSFHLPLYWITKIGSASYVASGTWNETEDDTDRMNAEDGSDVRVRDFTGHDFTAWVYDLHRPGEPYSARGRHPSGVGIDRYIKPSDLTPDELGYLRRQGRLQLLNFVDPFLVGSRGLSFDVHGEPLRVAATLGHVLTSFGRTIDTNVFLARGTARVSVTVHAYANGERSFAGVDATLVDYPVTLAGHPVTISPRVAVWQQPAGQLFHASAGQAGGLLALKVQHSSRRRVGFFGEVEAKSAGWVAGLEALDRNLALRAGLSVNLR